MLTGNSLSDFRIRSMGSDISGVSDAQLSALASYRDKPSHAVAPEHPDYVPSCSYCNTNEAICELAAERIDMAEADHRAAERGRPEESDGTVLVMGDMICRACLATQLEVLRRRLPDIHWIELALFIIEDKPKSLVMTTEAELDSVQAALQR